MLALDLHNQLEAARRKRRAAAASAAATATSVPIATPAEAVTPPSPIVAAPIPKPLRSLDAFGPQSLGGCLRGVDCLSFHNLGEAMEAPVANPMSMSPEASDRISAQKSMEALDNAPTAEEKHLAKWFREAYPTAVHAIEPNLGQDDRENTVWVAGVKEGPAAHRLEISHERMKRLSICFADGSLPKGPDPMPLYWIQKKPEDYKSTYGAWDPIQGRWRFHPNRTVMPIEKRFAPLDTGYGTKPYKKPDEQLHKDYSYFSDYEDLDLYTGTGLEPGIRWIQSQAEQLRVGMMLGTDHGWGEAKTGDALYYTPQLRHVEIDPRVPKAPGKEFVYGWFGSALPVQPDACEVFSPPGDWCASEGTWNNTNSCWVFPLTPQGQLIPSGVREVDTERERDVDMRAELEEEGY